MIDCYIFLGMDFKLGTAHIIELANLISEKLHRYGVEKKSELKIFLNEEDFKKVDEDLFYRNNDNEEEFVPSEGEIDVNFEELGIKIIKV